MRAAESSDCARPSPRADSKLPLFPPASPRARYSRCSTGARRVHMRFPVRRGIIAFRTGRTALSVSTTSQSRFAPPVPKAKLTAWRCWMGRASRKRHGSDIYRGSGHVHDFAASGTQLSGRYGRPRDSGEGAGEGANMNVPLPPGAGHATYVEAVERIVLPALDQFRPDAIIVACGFDAAAIDPLSRMLATAETFRVMTRQVMDAAALSAATVSCSCTKAAIRKSTCPFAAMPFLRNFRAARSLHRIRSGKSSQSGSQTGIWKPHTAECWANWPDISRSIECLSATSPESHVATPAA